MLQKDTVFLLSNELTRSTTFVYPGCNTYLHVIKQASYQCDNGLQSDGRVRGDVTQKSLLNGPYTLIHILVIALLAFFLGHFL